jgi:predicted tellurium resistance membrane protein TerC
MQYQIKTVVISTTQLFITKQSNLFYQQEVVLVWITIILILAKHQSAEGRAKDRPVELSVRENSEANGEMN